MRPGMVAVDIGANIGEVTADLAEAVGPTGRVFAIEPQSGCADEIQRRAPEAVVITAAVGEREGDVTFYLSHESPHASCYASNVRDPYPENAITVRMVTLDGLQGRGDIPTPIDAIKVDAQGAEWAILQGARRLLRTQHPLLYLELWRDGLAGARASIEAIVHTLIALGYRPDGLTWGEVVDQANREQGHSSIDVLFLPGKAA